MQRVDFNSPYYPYEKVQNGFVSMKGSEKIPKKILNYLLDLPDKYGYTPVDDNSRPRVRFAKWMWYDDANPLGQPLPTPKEKMSMVFDGDSPVVDTDEMRAKHPKGYRIYPQKLWLPEQTVAKTVLKVYTGRTTYPDEYTASIGMTFEVWCNTGIQNNTRTDDYNRACNLESCIMEALHGVNIAGVGVIEAGRYNNLENGAREVYDETGTNTGRRFHLSLTWKESDPPGEYDVLD